MAPVAALLVLLVVVVLLLLLLLLIREQGKTAWQMYASALHGSRGLLHFLVTPCATPKDCGDVRSGSLPQLFT